MFKPKYTNSHALVVGINRYREASHLGYAVNDARAVASALKSQFGFPTQNVTLLLDEDASRVAVLDAFMRLARGGTDLDDRVIVFFAGHGHTEPSSRGDVGYLVPWDGTPKRLTSMIRWDELTRNADLIVAKHLLFVMDACYGGLALTRGSTPGSKRFLTDMLLRRSRQVLTAGKANQVVADLGGPLPDHSVFTGHFIEALGGKAANPEGIITAQGVAAYVYHAVSQDDGSEQTPHFGHLQGDGDLIFSDQSIPSGTESDELTGLPDQLITMPMEEDDAVEQNHTTFEKAKEYIAEERFKIKLHDLVSAELGRAMTATAEDYFPLQDPWSIEKFEQRLKRYEDAVSELTRIQALICFWAEKYNERTLRLPASRIGNRITRGSGLVPWLQLRWYPVTLLLYAGGIAAIAAERYDNLRALLATPVLEKDTDASSDVSLIEVMMPKLGEMGQLFKHLPGRERQYTPRSEYLFKLLQPTIEETLFVGAEYESLFDRFELLLACESAYQADRATPTVWGPVGRYGWKHSRGYSSPLSLLQAEAARSGSSWGPLRAGLFGGDYQKFLQIMQSMQDRISRLGWH